MSNKVNFMVDNILETQLDEEAFDFIFDRGCFHVLAPEKRTDYVKTIHKTLAKDGFLFLKCFSIKEPMTEGPYKFSLKICHHSFQDTLLFQKLRRQFTKAHWRLGPEHCLLS